MENEKWMRPIILGRERCRYLKDGSRRGSHKSNNQRWGKKTQEYLASPKPRKDSISRRGEREALPANATAR